MKHFIYTYSESKPPRDGSGIVKTVRIYQVKRNKPELVAEGSDTFVSEFQLVMQTAEKAKLLPKKAFARNKSNGCLIYGSAWSLDQAEIACFTSVS